MPVNQESLRLPDLMCLNYQTKIAAEVKDFHAEDFLPKKEAKRTERFIAYAVAASRMAIENSGLVINSSNADRIGVITGCGLGGAFDP